MRIDETSSGWRPISPAYTPSSLKARILESHQALGGLRPIDLWSFHHTDNYDPSSPESLQSFITALTAVKELVAAGIVSNVGLCNCSAKHLEVAESIVPISNIQNKFSLWDRNAEKPVPPNNQAPKSSRAGLLHLCGPEFGRSFTPYGTLGGHSSRSGDLNLISAFPVLQAVAESVSERTQAIVSPHAVALAYYRYKFSSIVHIVGCRTVAHVGDALQSEGIRFTASEVESIDSAIPIKPC
jgi:aryl-alcohol dehydrogenase-like predicted oxidoreductase